MPVNSYANIQAEIADILARSDLTNQIVDAITLFEAEAAYELFRSRGTLARTVLIPSAPPARLVTGAATSGGLIQLTYTVGTGTDIVTGDIVSVSGVGGTTEANGTWKVTGTAGTITLDGSTFTNTYTSGGTIQQDLGFCALPTDYLGWSRVTFTGNPQADLEYVAPAVWDEEFHGASTSVPKVFTVESGFLKILPVSSTPLELLYWQITPALSGNFNWLATNRPDVYVMGALEKLYGLWVKDFNQAEAYGRKKIEVFNQIKMQRFREFNNMRIRLDRSSYGATP